MPHSVRHPRAVPRRAAPFSALRSKEAVGFDRKLGGTAEIGLRPFVGARAIFLWFDPKTVGKKFT